ncbi:MAG: hypothetical protein JSU83_23640 [Deltaproteobacteria bacterium]|nr:MAG: hypothetical protein JSU83_23640 [Deltaproteobacteria bacterium]
MKILYILRSEPDEDVDQFMSVITNGDQSKVQALYKGDVNWATLVDDIFSHDKVICWW